MSGTKRSRHSLGSDLQIELPRVKKRNNTPGGPPPRSINDDDSEDNVSVQGTTSDGASASSRIRTMSAASDASPSPLGSLSPAVGGSDWVKKASQARSWHEEVTCFGMLLGGSVRLFRILARLKKQITSTKHPVAFALRFRSDATTLLEPATSEEVGALDEKSTAQLKRLKGIVPSIRIEAYIDREEDEMGCGTQGKGNSSVLPLQLNIYGPDNNFSEVGCFLSDAGMFLQEPVFLPLGILSYRNPHFLSWDDTSRTPQLLASNEVSPFDFGMEVEAIIYSTNAVLQPCHFQQDPRIRTELKRLDLIESMGSDCLLRIWSTRHQISALQFMIAREAKEEGHFSLWEPTTINYRDGFVHKITKEKRYEKPGGCCGGILADEMGLGKSLSLLSLIVHTLDYARSCQRHAEGHDTVLQGGLCSGATLVITPKSTLYSWEQEWRRHISCDLKVHVYHGYGTGIDRDILAEQDIVFTTYETIASDVNQSHKLQAISWFRVILDEAHHIRNRTQAFQAVVNLKCGSRWCSSGTPVQNKLDDLFALTEFLGFYPVDNRANARRWILDPLGRKEENALENLRLVMRTVAIRRPKLSESDCKRSEREVLVELFQAEREQYDSTRTQARSMVTRTGNKSSAHTLLSFILRMRQLCSHGLSRGAIFRRPNLIRETSTCATVCDKCADSFNPADPKITTLTATDGPGYCPECAFENDISASLSTQSSSVQNGVYEDTTSIQRLEDQMIENLDDGVVEMEIDGPPVYETHTSSKIDSILRKLIGLDRARHRDSKPIKSLVFSCWTTTLDVLASALLRQRLQYARIDGSLTLEQRRAAINRFQSEQDLKIMLLSFGSGSVGLNLTAATHVHIVEPQWNPMVEAQAAARVDRLDQDKDIVILRYIVKDSVEELIKSRQRHKIWLAKLSTPHALINDDAETVESLNELESLIA